ncbi:UilS family quorum-quenching N-acyl-homoserine lactonase [Pantoea agglomerans]|uniref:UilS family quorum-quenching N-acyl-homoserine lactonase n=1 Tax=Enterobacter agglomerans TaxID=549 RepID=UPI0013BDE05B|nr:alpha/beta fold hydrolase [Pantoea agglomerans]NEG59840.1 alpha/beta fold hydrolase [Pantoea agglomerans]NEG98809.1 alpha/beta fold hydrolase [Pantoea agglomerans]NEH05207.1 alpha/beta fold hydrolase [Pantoea agglomerans]NEH16196.1 alpha/beta fold hydrolase [Pantoea agglomerans]
MDISEHIISNGIALTVRSLAGGDKKPVIILCHGFCGIKDILLPNFADVFAQAGFAAITFDYRGFGDSRGERGRLVPEMQIEDIGTVIRWARGQAEFDGQRIGLWGTSLGGGHVFGAAVRDNAIKCIVSQLAFANGEDIVTGQMGEEQKTEFLLTLDKMAEKQQSSGKEMFVGITRVLSDRESKAFFAANKAQYPKMDIKIPFLTIRETMRYKPAQAAAQVTCPTLVIVAGNDTVNPPEQGKALFRAVAAAEKKLYTVNHAQHYDVYSGEHFNDVARVQMEWFKTHL